jgi:hypothetical protein
MNLVYQPDNTINNRRGEGALTGFSTHAAICVVYGIGPIFQMCDLYVGYPAKRQPCRAVRRLRLPRNLTHIQRALVGHATDGLVTLVV